MLHAKRLILAALFAPGLVRCANESLADRESPTEVGSSSPRSDALGGDLVRRWGAPDGTSALEEDPLAGDAERDPPPPWEEDESCFASDPFSSPVVAFNRVVSLYPARDLVAVKVDESFLVTDTVRTGPSTVAQALDGGLLSNVFGVGDRAAVTWQDWSNETGYVQRLAVSSSCS